MKVICSGMSGFGIRGGVFMGAALAAWYFSFCSYFGASVGFLEPNVLVWPVSSLHGDGLGRGMWELETRVCGGGESSRPPIAQSRGARLAFKGPAEVGSRRGLALVTGVSRQIGF